MDFDDRIILQSTSILINPEELPLRRGGETLVITGSSRGGTSTVAYALRRAGLNLGVNVNPVTHEDNDVLKAVNEGKFDELIASRDAADARWGFKMPDAVTMLGELDEKLRKPLFVIVYRNPLTIGRSKTLNSPHFSDGKFGLIAAIGSGLEMLNAATRGLKDIISPALLVNIDTVNTDSRALVRELFDFACCDAEQDLFEQIAEEISRPGYKQLPA